MEKSFYIVLLGSIAGAEDIGNRGNVLEDTKKKTLQRRVFAVFALELTLG